MMCGWIGRVDPATASDDGARRLRIVASAAAHNVSAASTTAETGSRPAGRELAEPETDGGSDGEIEYPVSDAGATRRGQVSSSLQRAPSARSQVGDGVGGPNR